MSERLRSSWMTRRQALQRFGALAGAVPLSTPAAPAAMPQPELVPVDEFVNLFDFEKAARQRLPEAVFAAIAGGDREGFERITFRPRHLVPSHTLDLTAGLFGARMFAPILAGPVARQERFHPDGELATLAGAAAADAMLVLSHDTSKPLDELYTRSQRPFWFQVYVDRDTAAAEAQVRQAVGAGCTVLVVTAGKPAGDRLTTRPDWRAIDRLRKAAAVPVVLKGVATPGDGQEAVARGLQGVIVSNVGVAGRPGAIDALPAVIKAVGGKIPVLLEGSIRRGSDVVKALALGAQSVLISRPVMWGLAAYGAEGVQAVLQMLQTEVARSLINIGKPTLAQLDATAVRVHGRMLRPKPSA